MGKYTKQTFTKSKRDFYPTIDPDAARALAPHVDDKKYMEPCAGQGHLVSLLGDHSTARCFDAWDITDGPEFDASIVSADMFGGMDCIITNPPFTWKILDPIITHLSGIKPTWLLLPGDMMHNKRFAPHIRKCRTIVSVGRLYWMENKVKGMDNYVWYEFDQRFLGSTTFYGRDVA